MSSSTSSVTSPQRQQSPNKTPPKLDDSPQSTSSNPTHSPPRLLPAYDVAMVDAYVKSEPPSFLASPTSSTLPPFGPNPNISPKAAAALKRFELSIPSITSASEASKVSKWSLTPCAQYVSIKDQSQHLK